VADLLRHVGNRAATDLLSRVPAERGTSLSSVLGSLPDVAKGGLAPAGDARAEAEADRVADRAVERLARTPRDVGAAPGGAVPGPLAAALAPEVGDVSGISHDLDSRRSSEADAMGARAFAQGTDVVFGSGELDLSSRSGQHLAAHEVAHAALHPTSPSGSLVHAKLRGTSAALAAQGGGPTTRGARKTLGNKTHWDQIVDAVKAYEKVEDELVAKGADQALLLKTKPTMLKALASIEAACLAWQKANDQGGAEALAEGWHQDYVNPKTVKNKKGRSIKKDPKLQATDDRTKAPRRQAIAMLLPRIRMETADVAAGKWADTLGLSDRQLQTTGATASGQMNTVTELIYQTESGAFQGYFKADKGFEAKPVGRDTASGIRQADPNYSARSVAMYRLDRLLGAGVTARAEFAAHDGKMGLVLESAKGERAAESKVAYNSAGMKGDEDATFSADDTVLLQCLNKLEILDAIAGQLDRHEGNYYVQSSGGKVTGVTGIDLDMAFGADHKMDANDIENYKALPQSIDAEFGRRIVAVTDDDVRATLTGLLAQAEVDATVARIEQVRQAVRAAAANGTLVERWDPSMTARTGTVSDLKFASKRGTHSHEFMYGAMIRVGKRAITDASARITRFLSERAEPAAMGPPLIKLLASERRCVIPAAVEKAIYDNLVPADRQEEFTVALVDALLSSHQMNGAFIAIQEDATTGMTGATKDRIERCGRDALPLVLPQLLARYASTATV
jgi:hypothetical protein